jgi:hypothetical protein
MIVFSQQNQLLQRLTTIQHRNFQKTYIYGLKLRQSSSLSVL